MTVEHKMLSHRFRVARASRANFDTDFTDLSTDGTDRIPFARQRADTGAEAVRSFVESVSIVPREAAFRPIKRETRAIESSEGGIRKGQCRAPARPRLYPRNKYGFSHETRSLDGHSPFFGAPAHTELIDPHQFDLRIIGYIDGRPKGKHTAKILGLLAHSRNRQCINVHNEGCFRGGEGR